MIQRRVLLLAHGSIVFEVACPGDGAIEQPDTTTPHELTVRGVIFIEKALGLDTETHDAPERRQWQRLHVVQRQCSVLHTLPAGDRLDELCPRRPLWR